MRFLADENFPKPLIQIIRKAGFSIKSVQQRNLSGSPDKAVAALAIKEVISSLNSFLKEISKRGNSKEFNLKFSKQGLNEFTAKTLN